MTRPTRHEGDIDVIEEVQTLVNDSFTVSTLEVSKIQIFCDGIPACYANINSISWCFIFHLNLFFVFVNNFTGVSHIPFFYSAQHDVLPTCIAAFIV